MRPELDNPQALSPALEDTHPAPAAGTLTVTTQGRARAPAGEELATGLRLGHFRIERKLGAGGMGEVYLANDLALDRPVAIKVLPAGTTSGTARDRLIREARAQARVQHPNVAHIYFIGEEEGRLYFAMELVGGLTLADKLATGPLPVEDALAMIRAAALGLREAQRSGFLHRDIKPSNLMVDAHGVLKVLDFGLAAGAPECVSDGPVEQTTTAGTPLYMAPEQARGDAIDLRADIYALGATLFHLVSGQPPFRADSVDALMTMHATAARPPLPRGANPRTAIAALDALIVRMMAPRAEERFASYDELLRAIEQVSVQHTRPAGFWVRLMASGLDGLLVLLLFALVDAVPAAWGRALPLDWIVVPAFLLYSTIAVRRWGRTIGKALFELEVVSTDTGTRPTWRGAFKRAAVLGALPLLGELISVVIRLLDLPIFDIGDAVALGGVVVLVGVLLHASLRTFGKRAMWDRIAGTMVRYRTTR